MRSSKYSNRSFWWLCHCLPWNIYFIYSLVFYPLRKRTIIWRYQRLILSLKPP